MALERKEIIDLVQLAMKRVNVVPFEENKISFGTNPQIVEINESSVLVCECYINVMNENRTCHIGFSAVLAKATNVTFVVNVNGNDRPKEYPNTNATLGFTDFFLLNQGLHQIAIYAKATDKESTVSIAPGEARLGVYL